MEIISTDITLYTNEENTVVRLDLTEEQYKDIIEKYGTKHVITRTYKKMPYELDNKNLFFKYFLGAAHASLSVAKLWSASEVRKVGACQGALLLGFSPAL